MPRGKKTGSRGSSGATGSMSVPVTPGPLATPSTEGTASPIRVPSGSLAHTPQWLSMKDPELLTLSERVVHNNLAYLADAVDKLADACVYLAGGTPAKGKAASAEADAKVADRNKAIAAELAKENYAVALEDSMKQLKGNRKGPLAVRFSKYNTHIEQAKEYVALIADHAKKEHAAVTDTHEGSAHGAPGIFTQIHSWVQDFSEKGLSDWCISLIKRFDLYEGRSSTKSKQQSQKRKAVDGNDSDEDSDEDDDGDGGVEKSRRGKRAVGKRAKKQKTLQDVDWEGEDEDDEPIVGPCSKKGTRYDSDY